MARTSRSASANPAQPRRGLNSSDVCALLMLALPLLVALLRLCV